MRVTISFRNGLCQSITAALTGAKLTTVEYRSWQVQGTQVVRDGDFIAVLNENRDKSR